MSLQDSVTGGARQESLPRDSIFSMLSNQRRRFVIHYLRPTPGPVTIRDLVQQVAAWENGVEVDESNDKQRKRVYTCLHRTHLPKLDDADIVTYDRDRGTLALAERAALLDVHPDVVSEHDIPWSEFALGLSAVAAALLVAAWVDVTPLSALSDLAYALALALLFVGSALVHVSHTRRTRVGDTESPTEIARMLPTETTSED